jgi:minor histocompatibility antigen H13
MWSYTEDGSIDTVDVVVDLDGDGKPIKKIGELKDGIVDTTKTGDGETTEQQENKPEEEKHTEKGGHKVLLLSVEAPDDEIESL